MDYVLFLRMVLLRREVHRSNWFTSKQLQKNESYVQTISNNLMGNSRITFAEVVSLFCKKEKQLKIGLSYSKYRALSLICFAVIFVYNFQCFTNHS